MYNAKIIEKKLGNRSTSCFIRDKTIGTMSNIIGPNNTILSFFNFIIY